MEKTCKWLAKLPGDIITSWEKFVTAFRVQIFPALKTMTLRDNIKIFKWLQGDIILKTFLRFKKWLLQCLTHGLPDNIFVLYIYRSLDSANKGVVDQLSLGGLIQQSCFIEDHLLDRYIALHDQQKPKYYKSGHSKDLVSRILNKIDGFDKKFK